MFDPASKAECLSEFHSQAPWIAAMFNRETWLANRPNALAIFELVWLNVLCFFCVDRMHVKHLGTDPCFYGAVLAYLC